jgi:hypothetical protein
LDGSLPFPWNLARTEDLPTVEVRYRALLGLSDSDVFIGAAQAGEKSARDPVGFVRDELLRISGRDSIEEE